MTDPYSQQVPPPNDGRVYAPQYRAAPPSSPASITALGVIGTVLGGLGLVVQALGLLALAVPALREAMVGAYGPGYQPLVWVNAAVFGLVTVALLAGSIGCLRRAEWGRRLLVGWAAVYPVVALAGTLLSVLYYIPMTLAHPAGPPPPPGTFASGVASGLGVGMYVGAVLGFLVRLIFPAFCLAYLRRPYVRAAFDAANVGG